MGNLSKIKRDNLVSKIESLKLKYNEDEETRHLLNEIINELTEKKYGIIWEEHEEKVDIEMVNSIPVFTEDKSRELFLDSKDKYNFIIEGDNLHSLYLLDKTHHERIDVIYIDPPYNTRNNDFKYDDNFIDKEDNYRHSKWLSFMKNRLSIARKLLAETGVIFISIDDYEYPELKMLCDEIFGDNHISTFIAKLQGILTIKMLSQIIMSISYVLLKIKIR